jgi:hypothetical protein
MLLTHLKHADIDFIRWDECIENSVGGLPYAMSWYMNIVSPNWEAVVSTDYEYVMPITISSKFGVKYIVQPAITQQLGVFSTNDISEDILRLFISKIPYLSYQINLNENNFLTEMQPLPNYMLVLNKAYSEIQQAYSKNCIRNVSKANKLYLRVEVVTDSAEMIRFLVDNTTEKNENILEIFRQIVSLGQLENKTQNIGVRNADGDLIAAVCFLVTHKRLVYLLAVSNEEGKSKSAMFALVDYIIQKNATSELILDFEGSKIQDIARFYKGFGAINKPYGIIKKLRPDFLTGKF